MTTILPAALAQVYTATAQTLNNQITSSVVSEETDAINLAISSAIATGVRSIVVGGTTPMTGLAAPFDASPPSPFIGDIAVVGSSTPLPNGRIGTITFPSNHNLANSATVTLAGWTPSGWNGSYTSTNIALNSVSIPFSAAPTNATKTGTVSTVLSALASSATLLNAAATLTFAADHGLQVGASITLSGWTPTSWNGTYTVIAATTYELTFSFPAAPAATPTSIGTVAVNLPAIQTATLNGMQGDITFAVPHELLSGDVVELTGWTPAEWNGTYIITAYSPLIIYIPFITPPATDPTVIGALTYTSPPLASAMPTPYQGDIVFATDHGLVDNNVISLSGWLPANWNNTYTVVVVSPTEIKIDFVYANKPAVDATTLGTIDIYTPAATSGVVSGSTATVSGSIATLTFTAAHGLATGQQVVLSNWQTPGWNGTYAINVISPVAFTINFSGDATSYYKVWQGTETDATKTKLMNKVIDNFTSAGYTIVRILNSNTGNTFLWHVGW